MSFGRRNGPPSAKPPSGDYLPSGADLLPDAWTDSKAEVRAWKRARWRRMYPLWLRLTTAGIAFAGVAAQFLLPYGGKFAFIACITLATGMTLAHAREAGS